MKICFLTILQDSFTEKVYKNLSENIAISADQAKSGVRVIIPIVLASILENNTASSVVQPIWWSSLTESYAQKNDKSGNVDVMDEPFIDMKGRGISWYIFRFCFNDLAAIVSEKATIRKNNAVSLIEMTTPLIVGFLINWLEWNEWKFEDLIAHLLKSKREIIASLPTGISPVHLGINGMFFG